MSGQWTTLPLSAKPKMKTLQFHAEFESIHPFQDGNGRVGRLIMFKECLRNNIVPFIIDEQHKYSIIEDYGSGSRSQVF